MSAHHTAYVSTQDQEKGWERKVTALVEPSQEQRVGKSARFDCTNTSKKQGVAKIHHPVLQSQGASTDFQTNMTRGTKSIKVC
jgi:hypothetical protein